MSWAGFLFDTAIPWLLMVARLRPLAYCGVITFHVLTYLLFPRITMFPVIMIAAALVFFPPDWPRTLAAGWRRASGEPPPARALRPLASSGAFTWRQRAGLIALAIYAAVQLLVPLRFLLYGGDVRWHEQGLRFSWRVLHREKLGTVTFQVRSATTGQTWQVDPAHYLHPIQQTELGEQPDLILQLAHHIRDDFAHRGLGRVEVRARALCTLNGRPSALLIDPGVDLGSVKDSLAPASWILPVPSSPPPHTRATL
jgi:vitamin K-dependent gamma-carboxylase